MTGDYNIFKTMHATSNIAQPDRSKSKKEELQGKFNYCLEQLRPYLSPATYSKLLEEMENRINLEKMVS